MDTRKLLIPLLFACAAQALALDSRFQSATAHELIGYGDFNGDGKDDLCYINSDETAYVALAGFVPHRNQYEFLHPYSWGLLGFKNSPYEGTYGWNIIVGDVNEDGKVDLKDVVETFKRVVKKTSKKKK